MTLLVAGLDAGCTGVRGSCDQTGAWGLRQVCVAGILVGRGGSALVVWTLLELQDATVLSPLLASADRIVRHFAPSADTLKLIQN